MPCQSSCVVHLAYEFPEEGLNLELKLLEAMRSGIMRRFPLAQGSVFGFLPLRLDSLGGFQLGPPLAFPVELGLLATFAVPLADGFLLLDFAWSCVCLDLASRLLPVCGIYIYIYIYNFGGLKGTFHRTQPLPLALVLAPVAAMPLNPTDRNEQRRADRRAGVQLIADRVIRPQTRTRRDTLIEQFNSWLLEKVALTVQELVDDKNADPEVIANWLVIYRKELYYSGKAYGRFSETINAVASRRPVFRRQLVAAWDLAFCWVADEPTSHHPALPLTLLLAMTTLGLLWGWAKESAIFRMSWCGVLRAGEALNARRQDLILPCDGVPGRAFALLQIRQPKTRGSAAKHQSARIDPSDVVRYLTAVFGKLSRDDMLWNASSAVLRRRFTALQKALGLTTTRSSTSIPYDLASLRPGGATHTYFTGSRTQSLCVAEEGGSLHEFVKFIFKR